MGIQAPNPAESVTITGTIGTGDNTVIYLNDDDISRYDKHIIQCTAGTVDIDVSLDGTNWILALAGRAVKSTTPTTYVVEIAVAAGAIVVTGNYKYLRVNQKGSTASNAFINHSRSTS